MPRRPCADTGKDLPLSSSSLEVPCFSLSDAAKLARFFTHPQRPLSVSDSRGPALEVLAGGDGGVDVL